MKIHFALSLLLGSFAMTHAAAPLRADDDDKKPLVRDVEEQKNEEKETEPEGRPYRLGVATSPASEVLQAQLKLGEHGLVVEQILTDSPADKTGIRPFDILLSAGDKQLSTQDDLVAVMKSSGGKAIEIVLLHEGEKKTVEVKPLEADSAADGSGEPKAGKGTEKAREREELERSLRELSAASGDSIPPELLERILRSQFEPRLPDNVSVSVIRKIGEPVVITIKRDDKTWHVTEKELDQLPDDVRRLFARFNMPFFNEEQAGSHAMALRHRQEALYQQQRMMKEHLERLNKQMEELQKSIDELEKEDQDQDSE